MIILQERGLLWFSYAIMAGSSYGFYTEVKEREGEEHGEGAGKETETETDK